MPSVLQKRHLDIFNLSREKHLIHARIHVYRIFLTIYLPFNEMRIRLFLEKHKRFGTRPKWVNFFSLCMNRMIVYCVINYKQHLNAHWGFTIIYSNLKINKSYQA